MLPLIGDIFGITIAIVSAKGNYNALVKVYCSIRENWVPSWDVVASAISGAVVFGVLLWNDAKAILLQVRRYLARVAADAAASVKAFEMVPRLDAADDEARIVLRVEEMAIRRTDPGLAMRVL